MSPDIALTSILHLPSLPLPHFHLPLHARHWTKPSEHVIPLTPPGLLVPPFRRKRNSGLKNFNSSQKPCGDLKPGFSCSSNSKTPSFSLLISHISGESFQVKVRGRAKVRGPRPESHVGSTQQWMHAQCTRGVCQVGWGHSLYNPQPGL